MFNEAMEYELAVWARCTEEKDSANCFQVISRLLSSAGTLSIRATSSAYILAFLASISAI